MGWSEYSSALITGAGIGSMYGLTALGYYITYAISRTVNFAQGASLMIGAVLSFTLMQSWHWPTSLAVVMTLFCCALWGLAVERLGIQPFLRRGSDSWLMATVAMGLIAENIVLFTFGKDPRGMTSSLTQMGFSLAGLRLSAQQVMVPVVGFTIAGLLVLGMRYTAAGKALAAIALNTPAARLMGIDTGRFVILSFMISGMLAGVAGMMIAPLYTVSAGMGTIFGIKAFAAAILGGIDRPGGVMAGGLILGIVEATLVTAIGSTYAQMFTFGLTILVLVVKPVGLFGRQGIRKV